MNKKYINSSELKFLVARHVEASAEELRKKLRAEWKKQKMVENKYRLYVQSGI